MATRIREPLEGLRRHKLLPREVARTMPPLYAQDGKGMDAIVHLKLFNAYGRGTWYITEASATVVAGDESKQVPLAELDGAEAEDITFFCYCVSPVGPFGDELGYSSFKELATIKVFGGVPAIERDCHYGGIGKTLRECLESDR